MLKQIGHSVSWYGCCITFAVVLEYVFSSGGVRPRTPLAAMTRPASSSLGVGENQPTMLFFTSSRPLALCEVLPIDEAVVSFSSIPAAPELLAELLAAAGGTAWPVGFEKVVSGRLRRAKWTEASYSDSIARACSCIFAERLTRHALTRRINSQPKIRRSITPTTAATITITVWPFSSHQVGARYGGAGGDEPQAGRLPQWS